MRKAIPFIIVFVFLCLTVLPAQQQATIQAGYYVVDARYDSLPDTKAKQKLAGYKEEIDKKISQKVGESSRLMVAEMPESLLTNFITDILIIKGTEHLHEAVDISILNIGCFRDAMPEGTVTIGDIYNILPFDNVVEILYIRGKYLRELFAGFVAGKMQPVGNAAFVVQNQELKEVLIGETPLRDERLYKVATINYLRRGGDGMGILGHAEKVINTRVQLRDMVIQYISEQYNMGHKIDASLENRVIVE